jgi:hypothetical protein
MKDYYPILKLCQDLRDQMMEILINQDRGFESTKKTHPVDRLNLLFL